MVERIYHVPDVSCEHCVRAITNELRRIDGVREVSVDLTSKLVTVRADETVADSRLRAGIQEAGYDVAA